MQKMYTIFAISLSATLGACVDMADEDAANTSVAEQAIFHNEVRMRRIEAFALEEGGDEIFLTASQSQGGGGINIIRRSGDPDYWRFDEPFACYDVDKHIGTIVANSLLIVNLMEQDGGADDEIGTIDFKLDHTGEPTTFDTPTGKFVGMENGWFAVRFTRNANYKVWFQVGP